MEISERKLGLFELLMAPIRGLFQGHIYLILFSAFFIALAATIGIGGSLIFSKVISIKLANAPQNIPLYNAYLKLILALFSIPLVIYGVATPFKVIWNKENMSFSNIFDEMLTDLERIYVSFFISFIGLGVLSLALYGLIIGIKQAAYNFIGSSLMESDGGKILVLLCACFLTYLFLQSILNLISMPFVSTYSKFSFKKSWAAAPFILKDRKASLLLIILAAVLVSLGINALNFESSLLNFSLYFISNWYFLAAICVFFLNAAERMAALQFKALKKSTGQIHVKQANAATNLTGNARHDLEQKLGGNKPSKLTTQFSPKDLELILR